MQSASCETRPHHKQEQETPHQNTDRARDKKEKRTAAAMDRGGGAIFVQCYTAYCTVLYCTAKYGAAAAAAAAAGAVLTITPA